MAFDCKRLSLDKKERETLNEHCFGLQTLFRDELSKEEDGTCRESEINKTEKERKTDREGGGE